MASRKASDVLDMQVAIEELKSSNQINYDKVKWLTEQLNHKVLPKIQK